MIAKARVCLGAISLWAAAAACAGEVQVAVAANFSAPMQKIAAGFEKDSGHRVILSIGSSGNFYAQIRNGAPFQLLLSADQEIPERLERDGSSLPNSRFTYATGRLTLWSAQSPYVDAQGAVLKTGKFEHLAIADSRLAPYGAAALDVLQRLGVLEAVQSRLVQGENIAQTYQFVSTGNAQLGFVALSQIMRDGRVPAGSYWLVPDTLHRPLRQDAVVLTHRGDVGVALALAKYLQSEHARAIMRGYGYTHD
jgi:molybdate transport system substrate-binding protein